MEPTAILDFGLRQVGLWWSDYELVSHPDQFRQRFGLHLLHDAMKCKGVTRAGEPSRAPEHMVDDSGFCHAHGPAAPERMAERGRKGALSLRRKVKGSGLTEDDLAALEAHEDAKRWLEPIGRAVGTGRLGDRAAQAAIKAVSEWVRTEGERVGAAEFEALRQDVEKLKDLYGIRATRLRPVYATDRC